MKRHSRISANAAMEKMMRFVYNDESDITDDELDDSDFENDLQDLNGEIEGENL